MPIIGGLVLVGCSVTLSVGVVYRHTVLNIYIPLSHLARYM